MSTDDPNEDMNAAQPQDNETLTEDPSASHKVDGSGDGKSRTLAIVIALLVLVAVIGGCIWLIQRGGDSDDAAPGPEDSNSAYVDDKGSQEHPLDPAPGEGVGDMTLEIDGASAPVDPVQLTQDGQLIPPQDVHRLGWYSASAVPGAEGAVGSTVITGHVNYVGQGEGYAQRFVSMEEGEKLKIDMDGDEVEFKVTEAPYMLPKGADFPEVINDDSGPNRLVLITCGGDFVGGQLGYAQNIIVVAEPV